MQGLIWWSRHMQIPKMKSKWSKNYQPRTVYSFFRELQYDEFKLTQTRVGIRSYAYFIFCAIVTTFYICFCIDLVKMSNEFKRISISMIIIILIIKVDYNYHKNYPRIIWGIFCKSFITLTILYVEDCQTTTR